MKILALAALALLPTTALAFAAPASHHSAPRAHSLTRVLRYPAIMHLHSDSVTLQTGGTTATPAPTGTATPAPQPTGTPTTTYPDPVTILNNAILVYQQVTSAHFELILNGEQQGVEKQTLDAKGDVTCSSLALKGTLHAVDTLEGTAQTQHLNLSYVEIKTKAWIKGKSTKKVWKTTKQANLSNLGISVDNLLLCPNSATSGGSGSGSSSGASDQIKNLVNLGPDTFQGVAVWHIQAADVTTNASGQSTTGTLDFYISQDHFLPYVITYTENTSTVSLVQKQILTKFGEKVKIKAPTVGKA